MADTRSDKKHASNPFQTLARAVIMMGTLVVGALAWCVYGPPPEQLAPLLNKANQLVNQALRGDASGPAGAPHSDTLAAWDDPEAALKMLPTDAWPSAPELAAAPALAGDPALGAPIRQLEELGAHEVAVDAWGQSGLYRCRCVVPVAGSVDFLRNFDAVESTADLAAQRVAADIRAWQAGR
ncbi:hypothetical protein Pla175_52170 [Pirellulimonas nuda]|uniref:Uncharacterized protein n=1 Tax=Pirellulimonas nuda TaxID=2528009 RepID=A0A518DJZ7_9BACT|nr:hypothetical protein [Pirellulimonas nuda]QDU91786.1 hypothetical protein Pla175_52170 [Pirellulimonas nuda]